MTKQGRAAILVIWSLTALCAIFGAKQLETNFAQSFFIPPGSDVEKFFNFDLDHYRTGFNIDILNVNEEIDYTSEAVQYQIIDFWDKLKRCYLCDESWFSTYNFNLGWYHNYN